MVVIYQQWRRGALALAIGRSVLIGSSLIGSSLAHAQVHGAVQYPPASVGEDAQPPPPARMLPQPVSPWRVELGVSGSSLPPSTQRFYIRPPLRLDGLGAPPQSGSGG
jgi:hypothetical protein